MARRSGAEYVRTGGARPGSSKARRLFRRLNAQKYLYLLLLPGVVCLFLFQYVPMYGTIIAFKNYNPLFGIGGSRFLDPWYGNFLKLTDSIFFLRVLRNTLLLNLYGVLFAFPAPLLLALLLNELRRQKIKRTVQTITYMPHFLSWVIVGGFVVDVLSPNSGVVATITNMFNVKTSMALLSDPRYFRAIAIGSGIWKEVGWGSIIYLAAIAGISPEYYDAARVDGAGKIRQALNITIPCIMPTVMALLVLRFGHMLGSNFEQIFVLASPSTQSVADVIATYVYREGIQKGNYSFTTAVGLFQSVIGFVLVISANKVANRLGASLW